MMSILERFGNTQHPRNLGNCKDVWDYFNSKANLRDGSFNWTDECTRVFTVLKDKLINPPVLTVYSPLRETELHTDRSTSGFLSVLLQRQEDGNFTRSSKCTTSAEGKFHNFELETLAIIYALRRFRIYLEGILFIIVIDCNSLALTLSRKLVSPRITRWALE